MAFHRSPFVASGNPVFMQLEETASLFHNADYLISWCSGRLEMRHMSQLEMRQSSPLGMLVKRQRL
ncbi:hypothetical protein, partial [Sinorhizobium meliloti]|uniref:hypothetical protein n=1 Tax=Rhizobium meliloti TaxID=382 RepID=UPI001AECDC9E